MNISTYQKDRLMNLNHRALTRGEIVLLAKVISEKIPLPGPETTAIPQYVLSYRNIISEACDDLYKYTYISSEDENLLQSLVKSFFAWRFEVAHGTGFPVFSSDKNMVIDQLTLITNFVSCDDLSELTSVDSPGTWYNIFKELIEFNKLGE